MFLDPQMTRGDWLLVWFVHDFTLYGQRLDHARFTRINVFFVALPKA